MIPLKYRDDALIKASKMMLSLNEKCKEIDDTMVVTVGWIKAFPGEQNIIPGKVQMTVEIRSVHEQSIRKLVDHMKELCVQYDCDFELTLTQNPTVMSRLCMEAIHESAEELGLSDMVMQSGAGHDAMMIANVIRDTGMIFAPSKGGVSHCPQEWTEWSDVENSVNVLLHTILKLDKK
jgi:hydantoinase/carbamoylase family amidase